ncbi:MAG: Gfo/Idh/MocA family oxidoreductase [Balneolaceae bacterium]
MTKEKLNIIIIGCGNMGTSHARAYHKLEGFNIVGLVDRNQDNLDRLTDEMGTYPTFNDFDKALQETNPDAVCIATYPGTHAQFAVKALNAGAHVFVEKPIAETLEDANAIVDAAKRADRKVVVGYILRHHPGWKQFIEVASTLGKPLVMRMNLNQQSIGKEWKVHKSIMEAMSPIVDCGVHYVDVMCQMTKANPVSVSAIGARLSDEIDPDQYNYGQLQVRFDDGSVGWYESGWGPMISEQAYFVKDVMGPKGSVSISKNTFDLPRGSSSDIAEHTAVKQLRVHYSELDDYGNLKHDDELLNAPSEPGHDELCYLEQEFFLKSIQQDIDLSDHLREVVHTLKIVLASDESVKTGKTIELT